MFRSMDLWLPAYLRQAFSAKPMPNDGTPMTVYLTVADHFEPYWAGADHQTALERLRAWEIGLPRVADSLADSTGSPPQHCFFYPLEDYHPEVMDRLAALCGQGLGEVEVHLHHQGETSAQLEDMLSEFAETLHSKHGLLRRDPADGRVAYGFIHGNWALDNSRPDGKWCGVNDEISILARTGCYADFTLPSAPSPTQTRTINSIYYATDDPLRPKSHDRGRPAKLGQPPSGDLLMIQGVLALDWGRRKWGLLPKIEASDINASLPPHPDRVAIWLAHAPRVEGVDNACFIKLSCHGAPEKNHGALLGEEMIATYRYLIDHYDNGRRYRLRFVTCWEMARIVHALEAGQAPP